MSQLPPPPPPPPPLPPPHQGQQEPIRAAQWRLFAFLVVTMFGATAAWAVGGDSGLWQSGVYFIFIPGSMAALLAILPLPAGQTGYGVARGTTIAIFASAILVREGFICVLIALPLIIPVVALVAWSNRRIRQGGRAALLAPLLLVGISAEGVAYELPDHVVVHEVRVLESTPEALDASLDQPAVLPDLEPLLFALPFPEPVAFTGIGSDVGDRRIVEFDAGRLVLEVTERTEHSITWTIADNTTPLADWMTINDVRLTWQERPEGLELRMAIDFDRELAPAIYFDPVERWGVGEMAEVLLDMIESNLDA